MPPAHQLQRRLTHWRRHAMLWLGLRALLMAATVSLGAFAFAAMLLGKSAGGLSLAVAWFLVALSGLSALSWGARPMRRLGGARVARLLRRREPQLSRRARTAAELLEDPGTSSHELVRAYVDQAWSELRRVRTRWALPVDSLWQRDWLTCAAIGLVGAALLVGTGRGPRGTFTMLHPGARATDGTSIGVVFEQVTLRVAYPHYMRRPSVRLQAGGVLELPLGSSVTVEAIAGGDAIAARMHTPTGVLALRATHAGRFDGRFVIRSSGPLSLRASEDGEHFIEDARVTRLEVVADHSPSVMLLTPVAGAVVPPGALALSFEADDDWGLEGVEAMARGPQGAPVTRRVWREAGIADAMVKHASGEHVLDLADLDLRPGDRFTVWLEAWDSDDVSGPHRGRSPSVELEVESTHSRRTESISSLVALRLELTHHLAARLVPGERPEDLGQLLEGLGERLSRAANPEGVAPSLLSAIANHLATLGRSESAARGARAQRQARTRSTGGVEQDLLSLDDLVTAARLRDVRELAQELAALRQELAVLVAQMRSAPSPETRRAIAAAAGRVEARLREISARLAENTGPGSDEYLNPSDGDAAATRDAMAELRRALEADDMDAAERSLVQLEARIDALARGLGEADEAFAASTFGPRQAALAEAMARLTDLEAEQRSLAAATERLRFDAAQRALSSGDGAAVKPRLNAAAEAARASLRALPRRGLTPSDLRRLERSVAQIRDTADALRAGDLARGREQARATQASVEGLARDLELAELMSGSGERAVATERARLGREAEASMRELTTAIDHSIPDLRRHLDDASRRALEAARERQTRAREATTELAERFGATPDGRPLSTRAEGELRSVMDEMRGAERAFARPDPVEAGSRSTDAARALSRLRRELSESQRQRQRREGQRRAEHVRIHGRGEAAGASERRRRAMDALREEAPPGYEGALRSYYEGLLR